MKFSVKKQFLFFFFILLFIIALLRNDSVEWNKQKYDLKQDGVCIIQQAVDKNEIENLKTLCEKGEYKTLKKRLIENLRINQWIHENLGEEYMFQDYVWIIKKSSVHTCHRDNNGDFFNENQKHPSYTLLVYLENMDKCLGVVPQSHLESGSYGVNLINDPLVNLGCHEGDSIIFNANLIHVGTINDQDNHLRIQMKVSHRDDIEVLNYYQNFNKIVNEDNVVPKPVLRVQRNLSCMFPFVSDLSQGENIRTARGSSDGAEIGFFQKMFSYVFYGSATFYDLPDAF
jgi:ectoine hydroxylase-related dioxygenase (phytanoyl-CoA dioxygenase family)